MKLPKPYEGNEPYLFISYAHKDSALVVKIIEGLQRLGMRIWYDEGLEWGDNWRTKIERYLLESTYVVCFFTKHFFESEECKKEMGLAFEHKKGPLVIHLEKIVLPEDLKKDYNDFNALQLEKCGTQEELINRICGSSVVSSCRSEIWLPATAQQIMDEEIEEWKSIAEELLLEGKDKEALKWYRMAANQGDADAQYRVAVHYAYGSGVDKNLAEAVRWYRMAANQGDMYAQYEIGCCYEAGNGVEQDIDEAVRWYELAAEKGCELAQYRLGELYELGESVELDLEKSFRYYLGAARNDCDEAQYKVATLYEARENLYEAIKWYHRVSLCDHADALYKMGYYYEHGIVVQMDMNKAWGCYYRAARDGNVEAQYALGCWYEKRHNGTSKSSMSVHWYRSAARQGHPASQAALQRLGYDW